jgi:hypothetical protein
MQMQGTAGGMHGVNPVQQQQLLLLLLLLLFKQSVELTLSCCPYMPTHLWLHPHRHVNTFPRHVKSWQALLQLLQTPLLPSALCVSVAAATAAQQAENVAVPTALAAPPVQDSW